MKDIEKTLAFGSKTHDMVSQKLHSRLKLSRDRYSDAHAQMAKNEEQYRAFIPEQSEDSLLEHCQGPMQQPTMHNSQLQIMEQTLQQEQTCLLLT